MARPPVDFYLNLQYPFIAFAEAEGGYTILFPDLYGCMTCVDTVEEIPAMAEDARRGWIIVSYRNNREIPLPSYGEFLESHGVDLDAAMGRTVGASVR